MKEPKGFEESWLFKTGVLVVYMVLGLACVLAAITIYRDWIGGP